MLLYITECKTKLLAQQMRCRGAKGWGEQSMTTACARQSKWVGSHLAIWWQARNNKMHTGEKCESRSKKRDSWQKSLPYSWRFAELHFQHSMSAGATGAKGMAQHSSGPTEVCRSTGRLQYKVSTCQVSFL